MSISKEHRFQRVTSIVHVLLAMLRVGAIITAPVFIIVAVLLICKILDIQVYYTILLVGLRLLDIMG